MSIKMWIKKKRKMAYYWLITNFCCINAIDQQLCSLFRINSKIYYYVDFLLMLLHFPSVSGVVVLCVCVKMERRCLRIAGLYRILKICNDRLHFLLKSTSLEKIKWEPERYNFLLTNYWKMITSPNADGLKGIVAVPTIYLAGVLILWAAWKDQ